MFNTDWWDIVVSGIILLLIGGILGGLYLTITQAWIGLKLLLQRSKKLKQVYRRLQHKFRKRLAGVVMPKWKKSVIVDRLYDCILKMEVDKILSDHESKYLQSLLADALQTSDLLPRKLHKLAARAYYLGVWDKDGNIIKPPTHEKLAGPKQEHPAWGKADEPNGVPNEIVSNIDLLNKLRRAG